MAIQLCSLGSGSKGNCVLATNGKTKILLDAGLNPTIIIKKLNALHLTLADIDALFLTHEHEDHIKSVQVLGDVLPVYSHADTLDAVLEKYHIPIKNLMALEDEEFSVGTMDIKPFRISHDAVHPYGYCLTDWESKATYLTDTGYISKGMMEICRGSSVVMLEANHDKELLLGGKYPAYLKKRILGEKGHLSNEESALTVCDLIENGAKTVVLAHLSEQNNLPELAYWTVKNHLRSRLVDEEAYRLCVATQRETLVVE